MKKLLNTNQAAEYLSVSPETLKSSRFKKSLFGVEAPKHMKIGNAIRYTQEDLDAWIDRFTVKPEQDNSNQTAK
jgi:predicted DNA-binding transcriptional regulator AlpA